MQTVMLMHWPGVSEEQYEEARAKVRWETDTPEGAVLHVAGFDDGALRVLDVWDSQEQFERFMEERLGPAVQEIGMEGQPDVRFYPVHAIFNPKVPATA